MEQDMRESFWPSVAFMFITLDLLPLFLSVRRVAAANKWEELRGEAVLVLVRGCQ